MEKGWYMEKKKHIGRKIFLGILLILAAAAVGGCIYFYPVYKDAKFLQEHWSPKNFTYELEAKLNRENLEESRVKLLDTLAELTGLNREAMYDLEIKGSVDGDIIHAYIYPEGQQEPLIEIYLSDDIDVINGALLYNAVRNHYSSGSGLAAYLIPVWNDHEYVTLVQMEQMLDVDLEAVRDFSLSFPEEALSAKKGLILLGAMSREKSDGRCTYGLAAENVEIKIKINYESEAAVEAEVELEQPADFMTNMSEKFRAMELDLNGEKLRALDSLSAVVEMGKEERLQVPDDLISQQTVEIIKGIRYVIQEISGK